MSFEKLRADRERGTDRTNDQSISREKKFQPSQKKEHDRLIYIIETLELIDLLEELSEVVDITFGVRLYGVINDIKNQVQHNLFRVQKDDSKFRNLTGGVGIHNDKYLQVDELSLLKDIIRKDNKSLNKALLIEKPLIRLREDYGRSYEVLLSSILFLISTEMRSSGASDGKKYSYGLGLSVRSNGISINGELVIDTSRLPEIIEEKILKGEVVKLSQAVKTHGYK